MMKKLIFFMVLVIVVVTSCNKDYLEIPGKIQDVPATVQITSESWSDYTPEQLSKMYNDGIDELAISVAKALQNSNFRKALKREALIMIDGDYDIIWKEFKNKLIADENVSTLVAKNSRKSLSLETTLKRNDKFSKLFKQLQFSIPVNIEKWDEESYIPIVSYAPAVEGGFDENLVTYDEFGHKGTLNGNICPEFPVVVINLNERSDIDGKIFSQYYKYSPENLKSVVNGKLVLENLTKGSMAFGEVPTPGSVTGQYINDYILLSWYLEATEPGEYFMQMEKEINGSFNLISEQSTYGGNDSFIDTGPFEPGTTYLYRLRTRYIDQYGSEDYSQYSQVISVGVQAPGLAAPTNAKASIIGPNNINLTWDYPTNSNITGFKIRRRRPLNGESFDNDTPTFVSYSARSYIDTGTKSIGDQYEYEVKAYNSSGESIPDHDVTYNPYRSQSEHLYIKKIRFLHINDFEKWSLGAPEVEMTVAHGDYEGDTTLSVIYREERLNIFVELIPRNSEYQNVVEYGYCFDVFSRNWDSFFYKQVVNFNFVEYDAPSWFTGWKGLNFKVSIPLKIFKMEIKVEAATDINFNIRKSSEEIGETYLTFWDPKEHEILIQDDIIVSFSASLPVW